MWQHLGGNGETDGIREYREGPVTKNALEIATFNRICWGYSCILKLLLSDGLPTILNHLQFNVSKLILWRRLSEKEFKKKSISQLKLNYNEKLEQRKK